MTAPNPTPTTREREAAEEKRARKIKIPYWYSHTKDEGGVDEDELYKRIAAALARERRQAWNEACEKCANTCLAPNDSERCRKFKQ